VFEHLHLLIVLSVSIFLFPYFRGDRLVGHLATPFSGSLRRLIDGVVLLL